MLQFYFTQDIFGSIGLKPSAESKQASKAKAAAENTPPNVIRDRIIAVLIFRLTFILSGLRLNKPVVQ
jgi:POT family proton-dependent oligopeptide transporter